MLSTPYKVRDIKSYLFRIFFVILILILIFGPADLNSTKAQTASTTITLDPSAAVIKEGETISVSIRIDDVMNLYGADVNLSFDPQVLSVIDAYESISGINLEHGDVLDPPYYIVFNFADNTTGNIRYVLTQLNPTDPFSGSGVLAVIHFQAKQAGYSDLIFDNSKLGDDNGKEIPATNIDGTITIEAYNHDPVITDSDPQTVTMSEDGSPTPFGLTLHASDVDTGDTLTWSVSTPASQGAASASGTGTSVTVDYSPIANYFGTDSFVVRVSDGKGGTDSITVNVTIESVNDAPIAVDDEFSTQKNTALVLDEDDVAANDTDVENGALSVTTVSGASNGIVQLNSGKITFTPDTDFVGAAGFDYTVSDGDLTDVGHVSVNVTAVNRAPIITEGDSAEVIMSENGSPNPFKLTLHATDLDDDPLAWSILTPAQHGEAIAAGTGESINVGYTPDQDYTGSDSFVVQVSDGNGGVDTILVNVTINPVNIILRDIFLPLILN